VAHSIAQIRLPTTLSWHDATRQDGEMLSSSVEYPQKWLAQRRRDSIEYGHCVAHLSAYMSRYVVGLTCSIFPVFSPSCQPAVPSVAVLLLQERRALHHQPVRQWEGREVRGAIAVSLRLADPITPPPCREASMETTGQGCARLRASRIPHKHTTKYPWRSGSARWCVQPHIPRLPLRAMPREDARIALRVAGIPLLRGAPRQTRR
jgi:hypothetical protein